MSLLFKQTTLKKVASLCALATAMTVAGVASAATTIRLGWTTADSEIDPYAITARYFKEELEAAAPGEFNVRFFPSNQLGNDTEMLQGMQMGTLDAGVITGAQISTFDPAFQVLDLPFLFEDSAEAHRVLDSEAGQKLLGRLESKGIVGLGFSGAGFRHTINNTRPIQEPNDLKGIKLRVQPSSIYLSSFQELGANPVALPWSDAFTAVQQKTVDGLEIPLAVIYANKYAEEVKHLSLTNHTYNALGVLLSKRTFNKLTAEQQDIVRQAAAKAIARQRITVDQNEKDLLEKVQAEGMQVNSMADINSFRAVVKPIYDQYSGQIGSETFDSVMTQIAQ